MTLTQPIKKWPLLQSMQSTRFALLWSGQALSRIGDFLYEIALAWWVLQETGSASLMASVLIFALVPTVLISLLGGAIVDRYRRLPLMISADTVRGGLALLTAGLAFTDQLEIWHIFLFSLVFGLFDGIYQPAFAATIPRLVPDEQLSSANALNSFAIQAGRILGPPLGALLIALGGIGLAFAVNGLTFLGSAALLLPLKSSESIPQPPKAHPEQPGGLLMDIRTGIISVTGRPWLWITILLFTLTNITLAGPYAVAMPFLVSDVLQVEVEVLGFLYAMFAGGYMLGGIILGRLPMLPHRGRIIYFGVGFAGLMLALFGVSLSVPLLAAAALLNGTALQMATLAWTSTLQGLVPREQLGRVASIDMVGSFALLPLGFALCGWLIEIWGPAPLFWLGGGLTLLIALIAYQHPAVRALR